MRLNILIQTYIISCMLLFKKDILKTFISIDYPNPKINNQSSILSLSFSVYFTLFQQPFNQNLTLILNPNKKRMKPNKQEKKEKYACKFFLQGSCKNGVNCKFIHPVSVNHNSKIQNNEQKNEQKKHNFIKQNLMNLKDIEMSLQKIQVKQVQKKHPRDQYCQKMIDSMKIVCFSCHKKELPVYLSCGCGSICQDCANKNFPCGGENHKYDTKVYIK